MLELRQRPAGWRIGEGAAIVVYTPWSSTRPLGNETRWPLFLYDTNPSHLIPQEVEQQSPWNASRSILPDAHTLSSHNTSPTMRAASLYIPSAFSHFSLSCLTASSSYSSSSNKVSRYSSLTNRFCTASLL